jgi:hypothetical protein
MQFKVPIFFHELWDGIWGLIHQKLMKKVFYVTT